MTKATMTAGTAAIAYRTQMPDSCGYAVIVKTISAKAMNHKT